MSLAIDLQNISTLTLRMGVYPLRIETGRWRNLKLHQRTCEQCCANVVECEMHFLLFCARYEEERAEFFNNIVHNINHDFELFDDLEKLCFLLGDIPIRTGKFVMKI